MPQLSQFPGHSIASEGTRVSVPSCIQATRWPCGFKNVIPGQAEKMITRFCGTALSSSYRLTTSKALVKARKCVPGFAAAILAHGALVVPVEDVAKGVPPKKAVGQCLAISAAICVK